MNISRRKKYDFDRQFSFDLRLLDFLSLFFQIGNIWKVQIWYFKLWKNFLFIKEWAR